MPEQLTNHPEITLKVLRSAGAKCGEGAPQTILTQCPTERFCKLPAGELCVFGLTEAPQMTQISAFDWQTVHQALQAAQRPAEASSGVFLVGGTGVLIGVALGVILSRVRRSGT
jgi:hypothetical protein